MSNLHVFFALRNQQGFSKALDGSRSHANNSHAQPALSTSASRSLTRTIATSSGLHFDVNARDWLGRTVLHLACAVTEPYALAYVQLLLAHPQININIQDLESRWTALHRALYVGNITASLLLLQRSDIDIQLRDNEGFTAFDLYNLTIGGTGLRKRWINDPYDDEDVGADLLTWGANRNATLGHGDSDDRTFPDQVVLRLSNDTDDVPPIERFTTTRVKGISMAKLHTIVITDERRGNIRVCGFGSGGRLGPNHHTQYSLLPVSQFTHHVTAVALGQDHTLALTSAGEVFSWGLNRFSQLGYVVEPAIPTGPLHTRAMEEPIQAVARRVLGLLRKENVLGVAACKTASACWTSSDVFTWGTNSGQLGYDCTAQPVQILPRVVTGVEYVIGLGLTDNVMACLLDSNDVMCFRNGGRFRVKFPVPESDLPAYLPPFVSKPSIGKITTCDGVFAALSMRGDVYTFAVPTNECPEKYNVKPQRVWSAQRGFDPALDVALGSDGEVIVCTELGHVYVRSRSVNKSNISIFSTTKASKFYRIPYIHRAIKVCANSTGAFAALRQNYVPKKIPVEGSGIVEDVKRVRPWIKFDALGGNEDVSLQAIPTFIPADQEEETTLEGDVVDTVRLCTVLSAEKRCHKVGSKGLFRGQANNRLAHGADILVQAGMEIPAHRIMLAARSSTIRGLIESECRGSTQGRVLRDASITIKYHDNTKSEGTGLSRLTVTGCHSISVLLILEYIYSDDIPAIWDRRVGVPCAEHFTKLKINSVQVKTEVECLARILDLGFLSDALNTSAKCVPEGSFRLHMERLFDANNCPDSAAASPTPSSTANLSLSTISICSAALKPDVYLELDDRTVGCHSIFLRARCPFFQSFFDDEDWTIRRWTKEGTITIDMKHVEWRAAEFVLRWIYTGKDESIFDHVAVDSIHDLLDIIFSVMAVANELLLDKLMLTCSSTLLRYVTLTNVTSLLAEATYYNALSLVTTLQDYIACNLESIMESKLLDNSTFTPNISPDSDLIRSLSTFIRHKQADMLPVMRSNLLVDMTMSKEANVRWLEEQDIPSPILRSNPRERVGKASEKLPRRGSANVDSGSRGTTPLGSPTLGAVGSGTKVSPPRTPSSANKKSIPAHDGDDIFSMDVEVIPPLNITNDQLRTTPSSSMATPAITSSASPTTQVVRQVWRSSSESTKLDMRTIMAETAKVVATPTPPRAATDAISDPAISVSSSKAPSKLSQRERRRGDMNMTQVSPVPVQRTPASLATPWQLPMVHTSTVASPSLVSSRTGASIPAAPAISPVSHPLPSTPKTSKPPLGPVYTPVPAGKRTHSESSAWSNVPAIRDDPVVSAELSFAAIQQQQQSQGKEPKGKRSLRDIQEEERAKQEEEDFLRWWTAEEERLKAESTAADNPILNQGDRSSQTRRGRSRRRVTRGKEPEPHRGLPVSKNNQ